MESETLALKYNKNQLLRGYMLIKSDQVTILSTLKIKAVIFAFIANAIGMYNVCFSGSFIAIHFSKVYDVSDTEMGNYFII